MPVFQISGQIRAIRPGGICRGDHGRRTVVSQSRHLAPVVLGQRVCGVRGWGQGSAQSRRRENRPSGKVRVTVNIGGCWARGRAAHVEEEEEGEEDEAEKRLHS